MQTAHWCMKQRLLMWMLITVKELIDHFTFLGAHQATTAGSTYIKHKTFMAFNARELSN